MSDILAMTQPLNEIPVGEAQETIAKLRSLVKTLRQDVEIRLSGITNAPSAAQMSQIVRKVIYEEQRPGGILNPANTRPQIKVVMMRPLAPKPESNCPRTVSSFEEGHSVGTEFYSGMRCFTPAWAVTAPATRGFAGSNCTIQIAPGNTLKGILHGYK